MSFTCRSHYSYEWFERGRGSGFDWGRPGLIRFAAHRAAAERFILSLSFHHAIIDEWSLSLLVRDLPLSYAAALNGDAPAEAATVERRSDAFRDYVTAEVASRASTESRNFWRGLLADRLGATLPCCRSDGSDARWAEATLAVPEAREAQLQEVAHRVGLPAQARTTGGPPARAGATHRRLRRPERRVHPRPPGNRGRRSAGRDVPSFPTPPGTDRTQTWLEITEQVFASEMRSVARRECAASAATAGEASLRCAVQLHRVSRLRGGFHTERLRARQRPPI